MVQDILWCFSGSEVRYMGSERVSGIFRDILGSFEGFSEGFKCVTGTVLGVSSDLR